MSFLFFHIFAGLVLAGGEGLPPEGGQLVTARMEDRVVKVFDFDEQKLGNYESMPRNWRPIVGPGYPRFLEPRFDLTIGHAAPPSFKLPVDGGSVGAAYWSRDIHVHPGCDYEISAWIRSEGLVHAGASLSAYYLDHALNPIPKSERRSEIIRGEGGEGWRQVRIRLPGGFEQARWMGLSCGVEQQQATDAAPDAPRGIAEHDVHAAAWLDDITVVRLPQTSLRLESGPIFSTERPIRLMARVADLDGRGISATLYILDADSAVVEKHAVEPVGIEQQGRLVQIGDLAAGRYTARLLVSAGSETVTTDEQSFLRIAPDGAIARRGGSRIGVVLDGTVVDGQYQVDDLVGQFGPGMVKVPVWRSDLSAESILKGEAVVDRLLRRLDKRQTGVVAVLASPPTCLVHSEAPASADVQGVFSGPAEKWRAYLGFVVSHYGPKAQAWQVGSDFAGAQAGTETTTAALRNVREELRGLLGPAQLTVPVQPGCMAPMRSASPADVLSVMLQEKISAARIPDCLDTLRGGGYRTFWVTLEALPADRYPRGVRLAEWGRRILTALRSGAQCVFVPQPWHFESRDGATQPVVDEEFIVERTIGQALAGMSPVGPVWLDHGVEAWLFSDAAGHGAIAAWTRGQEIEPRSVWVDAGADARRIDLWGHTMALTALAGERSVSVGATPVIISPVAAARFATIASFDLDAPGLRVAVDEQVRTVSLTNAGLSPLRGKLRLTVPAGWRIRPGIVAIDLLPGQTTQCEVAIRLPNNQAVGDFVLVGWLEVEGKEPESLMMRTPLYVGAPGLDVNVLTRAEGESLRVVQRITNTSDRPLQLEASVTCTRAPRLCRMIPNLMPGQTAVREFVLPSVSKLAGPYIRTSVEEIGGGLRQHQLTKVK